MPERCRFCGVSTDGKSRLRVVREEWLRETADGPPGYMDITLGVYCGNSCLAADSLGQALQEVEGE